MEEVALFKPVQIGEMFQSKEQGMTRKSYGRLQRKRDSRLTRTFTCYVKEWRGMQRALNLALAIKGQ